jgi:hypothetical protein
MREFFALILINRDIFERFENGFLCDWSFFCVFPDFHARLNSLVCGL